MEACAAALHAGSACHRCRRERNVLLRQGGVHFLRSWDGGLGFATVQRGRFRQPVLGDLTIYVKDADALCAGFCGKGVQVARGPEDIYHALRDFDISDANGHINSFGLDLEWDGTLPSFMETFDD